ncbi:MAG: hypothetical protein SF028_14105 [Candidatus Sumerlaeia bacterium]|nr:hypothetical protein [Candidatus Sumerlaeia bacterium]
MDGSGEVLDAMAHRKLAVSYFNATWDLMEKKDRSRDEADRMIHMAHASRFHWEIAGTEVNIARGEWQVSRVYAILGRGEPALYHARRCLEVTEAARLGGFDVAFAHEAMARAHAALGEKEAARRFADRAKSVGAAIEEQHDREHFFRELATIAL